MGMVTRIVAITSIALLVSLAACQGPTRPFLITYRAAPRRSPHSALPATVDDASAALADAAERVVQRWVMSRG
jgi:hypothetical protein